MPFLHGGYLGVDAFFVLSGYLITSLLVQERRRNGSVALGSFWRRRARRLLPALVATVGVVVGVALVAGHGHPGAVGGDAVATLAYVGNWRFVATNSSYFGHAAPPSPLLHTWSLAIEEQFYVLWPPLLVLAMGRRWRRRRVAVAVAAAAVASALAMALRYAPGHDPTRVYLGTDTHAQSILVGVALALVLAGRADRWRTALVTRSRGIGVAGAAVTLWLWWAAAGDRPWVYRGGFLVAALASAAVIVAGLADRHGPLARALSARPLRWLGEVSYTLYLWHWPVILFVTAERTGLHGNLLLALRIALSVGLADLTSRLVEQPVRRRVWPRARSVATATAVTAASLLVLAGCAAEKGSTARTAAASTSTSAAAATAAAPTTAGASPTTGAAPAAVPPRTRAAGAPVKVLVVGDSVGKTLADNIAAYAGANHVQLENQAVLGCGVVRGGPLRYFGALMDELPQCKTWPQTWHDDVEKGDPDVVAVVIGRWEVMDRVHDGRWTHIGDPAFDAYLASELEQMVTPLTVRGARLAVFTAPYYHRGERPDGGDFPEDDPARVDRFNELLRAFAAKHPGVVTLVDINRRLGPDGRYTKVVEGVPVRTDGVHISVAGGKWLAPWLFPQLTALAG